MRIPLAEREGYIAVARGVENAILPADSTPRPAPMRYWTECREFYRQFRAQYGTTGSVLPSSRALARALTRPMRACPTPRRVLEVGPGTGAVTREIVRTLRPGDR